MNISVFLLHRDYSNMQTNDEIKKPLPVVDKYENDVQKFNCLLIKNESEEAAVTLYIYATSDPFCKISITSKIIPPSQKYFHSDETTFKFELVASIKGEKTTLLGPVKWSEDKVIRVTEALTLVEEKLAEFPKEKRLCLRKVYREKELRRTCGGVNLYEVLGLDMDEVRKMKNTDEQKKVIKKAYREKIRIWHPDKNFGDEEITLQIIFARDILLDDEKRVRYHNEADYDQGWFSLKRWKAIFWPECFTAEQKFAYRRRMIMLGVSAGLSVGGIALAVLTAGATTPATVVCGAVFGFGFSGAGMQSLMETIKKDSVVDGCEFKKWISKAGIGFVGGAVTGGAAAGITAGIVGIGSTALQSGAVTAGQYVGIGAATGAVGGASSSLASDASKKFVDGEEVTWRQAIGHAACGALVGAGAGAAGGVATQGVVSHQSSAAAVTLEGDIAEQILVVRGASRLGNAIARGVTRQLTQIGAEAILGTTTQFAEERLDDSVENQHPLEHIKRGAKNAAGKAVVDGAVTVGGALVSHAANEYTVGKKMKESTINADDEKTIRRSVRYELSKNNTMKWRDGKGYEKYEPIEREQPLEEINQSNDINMEGEEGEECNEAHQDDTTESYEGMIKYISTGAWISQMIVTYVLNDEPREEIVKGSGKSVKIPSTATQIEIRFQVCRPIWGDIMKYDRFKEDWCCPQEPHVFRYKKPPIRTFTISGNLWWEAVMRVSNEYHEETFEMEGIIE